MEGLKTELRLGLRRVRYDRLFPFFLAASVGLVLLVTVTTGTPGGSDHRELAFLRSANEIVELVLAITAILSAYRLLAADLDADFESLGQGGVPRPIEFAAGRVLAGAGVLFVAAAVLLITVEVVDVGGRHRVDEAVRVAVLFANALPLFLLAMAFTCLAGRLAGPLTAVLLRSWGTEAAYDRGALSDGFIAPNVLLTIEQAGAWLAPWPLLDRLPGLSLRDQSQVLRQFPVRQGQAVWGADLIQVSGVADVIHYALYLAAIGALLYYACHRRAARARSRPPVAQWFGAGTRRQ